MYTKSLKNLFFCLFFLSQTIHSKAQLFINEWMADNTSTIADESGSFEDWLEIYNAGDETIDLQGYYLSDDASTPDKFLINNSILIPADGYFLFWADNDEVEGINHLNFKLSANGEEILLFNSSLELVHAVTFAAQNGDVSMGSYPDGSSNLFLFESSTPEASNGMDGTPASLAAPIFSQIGGLYEQSIQLELQTAQEQTQIYYTTDGSAPSENDLLYTSPISINSTTIIRAITTKANFPNSPIVAQSYFVNENFDLPVLSLIADPEDLFGSENGIYANPYEGGSDWERYCQLQYFETEDLTFDVNAGIRIQGSSSVGLPKKSFRLFFESGYGQKWFEYPLFENNAVTRFRNLVLRSGYDDDLTSSTGTLLRDPFCSEKYSETGGLVSDAEWAVLMINGNYWGIYEIRESVNDHFIESHIGTDDFDQVRFTKEEPELKNGSIDDYLTLIDFLENNDLSDPVKYAQAEEWIDMDNLINLLAFINCTAYSSWTWGVTTYKKNTEGGKWKFTVWDMDRSLFQNGWDGMAEMQNTDGIYAENIIPKALIENIDFRNQLINRTADFFNTIFNAEQSLIDLEEIKNKISAEVPNELAKWAPDKSVLDWEDDIDKINFFLEHRKEVIQDQTVTAFSLPNTNSLTLNIQGAGSLELNTLHHKSFPWTGEYYEDVPIRLTALPAAGYIFAGWSDTSLPNESTIDLDFAGSKNLTAIFMEGNTAINEIVINEINYHSADSLDAGDWIELYNNSAETAIIEGWYLEDEASNYFNIPQNITIAPGEYLVVAEDLEKFANIYPGISNVIGSFGNQSLDNFGLSNAGETIQFLNANRSFSDQVPYDDKAPWPISPDGTGPTLQLVAADLDNAIPGNWAAAAATPGQENFVPLKAPQEIIFNSIPFQYPLNAPFSLSANSNAGLAIDFTIVSGPASLQGDVVTLDGVIGTVIIEASQEGDANYLPAIPVQQSFEILGQPQEITFDEIDDQLPTAAPLNIVANASSGLPLEFEYLSGPAQLDGQEIILTGDLGMVVIEINQAGNNTYAPADEQFLTFTVDKREQLISFTEIDDQLTTAPDFEITASSDAGLPLTIDVISGPATIDNETISLTGTSGMVTLRARQLGDDNTHIADEVIRTFDVLLTPQSIDFPELDNHLNSDLPFTIEANSSVGLAVHFEIIDGPATVLDNVITLTGGIGTVIVQAKQDGNQTYAAAPSVARSFLVTEIVLLSQTIEFPTIDDKYTFDEPFAISGVASSGLPVTFSILSGPATILDNVITLDGTEGIVEVAAAQTGDQDYYPAATITKSFAVIKITPEDQTITFADIDDQFTTAAPIPLMATASSSLPVTFILTEGPAFIENEQVVLTGAEGKVVLRALQTGNNFYNAALPVEIDFTVTLRMEDFPQPYCLVDVEENESAYFSAVKFGAIDHESEAEGFADNTDMVTSVRQDRNYPFSTAIEMDAMSTAHYLNIWLDANRDGQFEATEELVFNQVVNSSTIIDGLIAIPAEARLGLTKLRMAVTASDTTDPCLAVLEGEVEDYGVYIDVASATEGIAPIQESIVAFPNPGTGLFQIKTDGFAPNLVNVFNTFGQKMPVSNTLNLFPENVSLDLSHLKNGTYLVELVRQDGDSRMLKIILFR